MPTAAVARNPAARAQALLRILTHNLPKPLSKRPWLIVSIAVFIALNLKRRLERAREDRGKPGKRIPIPHRLPGGWDTIFEFLYWSFNFREFDYLAKVSKRIGNTMNFQVNNQDFVIVLEPSSIAHVLSKNWENYIKGTYYLDGWVE